MAVHARTRPAGTWTRVGLALLGALLLPALTGCSQGASATLDQALKSGASSTATAAQALRLLADGRSTSAVTSSALQDMLQELDSSVGQVAQASTASNADRVARGRVLAALESAVSGLTTAEDAVAHTPGAPSLGAAATRIDTVTRRLHALEKSGGTA